MIKRALHVVRFLESAVLVALLSTMIGLAAYQVIARNFYDTGLLWGDALVRVLVFWITLLGAMVASRNDEHIRIDILTKLLPQKYLVPVQRGVALATASLLAVFAWTSFKTVRETYEYADIAFASVPLWIAEAVIPFGVAVMCIRYVLHVFKPPVRELS